MFARFIMFGVCLLAAWLIWRAVRRWIDMSSERRGDNDADETRRLDHRPDVGAPAAWKEGASSDRIGNGGRERLHGDSSGNTGDSETPGRGSGGGSDD